jgi:hypothetical protein
VLHYLDVMIGFVFTMLVLSLAVTAIVQAVPVYLRNLKGVSLQRGLTDLLFRIAGELKLEERAIDGLGKTVDTILRDPLLSPPRWWGSLQLRKFTAQISGSQVKERARSAVVQREEFVRLLLDFAGTADDATTPTAVIEARGVARALLGVETAKEALDLLGKMRERIAQLELEHHDWSNSRRADQAMLEILLFGNTRNFMAKLVGWYDQTIDRVDGAFTARVRVWTTSLSAALVLVLQLDSFGLLAKLNADAALRDKVVASAITSMEQGELKPAAPGATPEAATKAMECAGAHLTRAGRNPDMKAYAQCMGLAQATELGLVAWPKDAAEWKGNWAPAGVALSLQALGMLLSLGLLSLGAPFWYEMLSNLIKLRSTIARKDERAREERQMTQGS